jgi:serine/threonine protein phosphatase PrpC
MTLALRYAVRSDVGLLREGNEDSAYAGPHLLAVADGMGGHAAGEVASAAAIESMSGLDTEYPQTDLVQALAGGVVSANIRLQQMIISDPATEGMGTTLTAMLWVAGHAAICHIGDSRAYLLRDGRLYQITHDHTLVQSLVDEGRITEDDVATHPQRSLLLRALDGRTVAEPDLSTLQTLPGDRYLLCSDGLSGVVTEETLQHALNTIADPDHIAAQLVDLAIRGGGPDNITCIVADVIDTDVTQVMPTTIPVTAGAAANGSSAQLQETARQNSPAGRARLTQTKPQRSVPDAPDEEATLPGATRGNRHGLSDEDAENGLGDGDGHPRRRRLPIVTSVLVLFALALIGGGIVGYQYVQDQYYVGEDSGHVAIFRGVNQDVAGIGLSSLYKRTGIIFSQVNAQDADQIRQTISVPSLSSAWQTVNNIRFSVNTCRGQWTALKDWQAKDLAYKSALAQKHAHPRAKITVPPNPGVQPLAPGDQCAAATAFGIAKADLPPAISGTTSTAPANPSNQPSASASPGTTR